MTHVLANDVAVTVLLIMLEAQKRHMLVGRPPLNVQERRARRLSGK